MPLSMASFATLEGLPLILYARVSKDQRGGRSVNQQLKRGQRWGDAHGCDIVAKYSDNDRSASSYASKERENWPKVEADIRAGKAKALWIFEISRGTRDLEVWVKLAKVCRKQGILIILDDDVYDMTKASHRRQLNQLMVDAEYESDKTAERINRDAEAIAEEGRPWGYAGFGFKREYDPGTGELLRQVPDPEQMVLVEMIASRLEAGERPYTIAKDLNARGIPTPGGTVAGEERTHKDGTEYISRGWTHAVVARLVSRPAMMGRRVHHGDIKPEGGWEPILKEERWQLIHDKVTAKPRRREAAIVHLLSGVAICDVCTGWMRIVDRSDTGRPAYRCDGLYDGAPEGMGHVQRVKHLLEAQVEGLLFERFSDPDVIDAFWKKSGPDPKVQKAQAELKKLQKELQELYMEVEAGEVTRGMAKADEARLKRGIADLKPEARRRADEPIVRALIEEEPVRVWAGWDLHQRREALRFVAEEIRVLKTSARGRRSPPVEESVWVRWKGEDV